MPRDDTATLTVPGWRAWCAMRPDGTLDRTIGLRPYPGTVWKGIVVSRFGADPNDREGFHVARAQAQAAGWKVVPVDVDVRVTEYAGRWKPEDLEAWRMGVNSSAPTHVRRA